MISSDLKTANLSPRASLPFSWNSDGDSGIATGRPTEATAFQAHLKSAQSAQSSETGSSPVADAPQKAETSGSADPSSRVSFQNPSSDPQVRPSIKPIRKASLNLRAMVDAKVRFIGPSTASISTPSVSSSVPSAQAGPSSWGEPFGPAERSESELRRPPALTSGDSPRNDVLQGMPERPLMDSQRLPDAEVVILRNRSGDPQEVPTAKQISSDVFSTPSDGGRTYASRMVAESPDYASSTDSNSEIKPEFASALEELPAMVSTNSGGGESTSNPQTIAAMSGRVAAVQISANGSLRTAVTTETFQSLPTSRSATASDPSMGIDLISSEVRDAARRAVAQSQLLGTSPVAGVSVRPANNNDAFRSLILDPGTGALPSLTTDLAPSLGGRLSDNDSKQNPSSPLATGLSSVLPTSSTMARTSETNGAEPSANTRLETVQNGVSDPTRAQRNLATTAPTPSILPVESGSKNGEVIQREARSVNPSSQLIENASANNPSETAANRVPNPNGVQRNLATTAPTPSITQLESGSQNSALFQREARSVNTSSQLIENASANIPSETVGSRVSDPTGVQRNVATTAPTPSILPVESGSKNGEVIQREARSANPNPGLSENPSTVEATDSSAASQSSLAESQSPPKPSGPSLRPANRSPHARGIDSVASTVAARTSVEADKSSPTPLVLANGTEDRMRLDSLGRDAGSGSSSNPGPEHSQTPGTPAAGLFPGASQSPSFQEPLVDGASNLSKTADAGTSASLLHESHKPSAVRLVHLDSPGAGGLELRIQEVGEKLIIRTQDLVGSIDGQSTQWKELQQRLETSGIVLMPIEASLGATAAPIEARSSSEELRHTVCYDGSMGSTGRDSSDPRSSSGQARSSGEPSHLVAPELPDETTESAEVLPASRQWWA